MCNLHLHVEFNFPLGRTCVKLALKCPSVKAQCLGGCLLFYLKFILHFKKKQRANSPRSCQNGDCGPKFKIIDHSNWSQSTPQMLQNASKIKISPAVLITPMTDLSSGASPSRKSQFYYYFSPRNLDGIWFWGVAILNFKLVPWCLDILWLLLSSQFCPTCHHTNFSWK